MYVHVCGDTLGSAGSDEPPQHLCPGMVTESPPYCQSVHAGQVRIDRCLCQTAEMIAEFCSVPPFFNFLIYLFLNFLKWFCI